MQSSMKTCKIRLSPEMGDGTSSLRIDSAAAAAIFPGNLVPPHSPSVLCLLSFVCYLERKVAGDGDVR